MNREEIQQSVVALFKNNKAIALQWATSMGKSKAAIDMLNEYQVATKKQLKILLLVAETTHKNNWRDEFAKWGLSPFIDVIIECYASLKNYVNEQFDIVIMDEAHHIGSDIRLNYFKTLKANKYILLSATLSYSLLDTLENYIGKIKTSKIGLQKAIDNSIIPTPKIFTIPLTLNTIDINQVIQEEWGKKDKRINITCNYIDRWKYLKYKKTKYPNVSLNILCTEQQKYNYLTEQLEYYKRRFMTTRNEAIKNKWLQLGSKRKLFLGSIKTKYVNKLLDNLLYKNKRFICFCTNIEQANKLGKTNAIHSEIQNRLDILDKFNNKKINSLYAVGMLQEGINLTDIEAGIIVQLDGQERAFIQKFGKQICQYVSNSVEVI